MKLYGETGEIAFVSVARIVPGAWVCLMDHEGQTASNWTQIDTDRKATFADPIREAQITGYLIRASMDDPAMYLVEVEHVITVRPGNVPVELKVWPI